MATSADVPSRFDVLINGQGYVFDDAIDPTSVYSSRQRAQFGFTPVFVPRQNVQGDYGDNQQDFWMTATQRDWNLGEQQRYFRPGDDDGKRRFWQGSAVDVRTPGQVSGRAAASTVTFASAPSALATVPVNPVASNLSTLIAAGATANLHTVDSALAVVDRGAHGLGAAPSPWGVTSDGVNVFLTTLSGGTVGVRKWTGAAFSTFSASGADALAFVNNTLYGLRNANGDFVRWDTAGVLTSLFTWKDAAGTAIPLGMSSKLIPFGGKVAILRVPRDPATGSEFVAADFNAEVWIYDGTAPALAFRLPQGFRAYDIAEAQGTLFISGVMPLASGSSSVRSPAIFFLSGGTSGLLWRGYSSSSIAPALCSWGSGLMFSDASRTALMFYDAGSGGIQTISTSWVATDSSAMTAAGSFLVASKNALGATSPSTTGYAFRDTGAVATSATVTTSLFDFESSLDKRFHAIRVDFDSATDGNGGSVDIAYRLNDVDGSYTSLATGVTSGSEVSLSNIRGRSISVKVTLNKGTSTAGPVLKRIAVRASPVQPQFIIESYILDCSGTARVPESLIELRDGSRHGKTGLEMLADLKTAVASQNPISVTDPVNGTFTAIIDADTFRAQAIKHMEEFRVELTVRQV